jgi:hypothetical protein
MERCRSRSPLVSSREKHAVESEGNSAARREYRVLDGMCFMIRRHESADVPGFAERVQPAIDSRCLRAILEGIGENAVTARAGVRIALEFRGHSLSERTVAVALDALTTASERAVVAASDESLSRSVTLPRWSTERATPSLGVRAGC